MTTPYYRWRGSGSSTLPGSPYGYYWTARFRGLRRLDRSLAGDSAIFDNDHHRSARDDHDHHLASRDHDHHDGFDPLPPSTTTTAPSTTSTTLAGVIFPDVPPAHSFYEEIVGLASAGVVSGYDDGLFHPDDLVTRAQFAKIIVLALGKHTAEIDNVADPTFTDVRYAGSDYPFDYVEEAAGWASSRVTAMAGSVLRPT